MKSPRTGRIWLDPLKPAVGILRKLDKAVAVPSIPQTSAASSASVGTLKPGGQMSLAPPSAQAANANLWTRSAKGSKSGSFHMYSGSAHFNDAVRTMGFSVRCIQG
jgi:hypothetical protein